MAASREPCSIRSSSSSQYVRNVTSDIANYPRENGTTVFEFHLDIL
jgi:hypothetical protein